MAPARHRFQLPSAMTEQRGGDILQNPIYWVAGSDWVQVIVERADLQDAGLGKSCG
ncbi:hypothetical protein BN2364_0549 [Alloalcanivorax xenomutans]|nr:hypothetical protein BN2364_0549 [Alloalcanivorax xenomutans]